MKLEFDYSKLKGKIREVFNTQSSFAEQLGISTYSLYKKLSKGVSDEELARRVWTGEFGNGDTRKAKLGSRYNAVQALVDKGVGKPAPSQPSTPSTPSQPSDDLLTLVKKTIRGDFGNGDARRKALGSRYDEVQNQVNKNLNAGLTRWDNIKLF